MTWHEQKEETENIGLRKSSGSGNVIGCGTGNDVIKGI